LCDSALRNGLAFCTRDDSRVPDLPQSLAKAVSAKRSASVMGGIADACVFAQSHATRFVRTEPPMSNTVFRSFCRSLCTSHTSLAPNPSVNTDAPVHVFNSASTCGGAPVTLIR
jgi:catechol 2,3-dioxygenase-like lactoylglutathione lyase family enzyme